MEELFKDLVSIIFKLFWANCWFISYRTVKEKSMNTFYFLMFLAYIVFVTVDVYSCFYK